MRVFLTGGSGFVGSAVIDALISRGHDVNALASSRPIPDHGGKVTSFSGGLFDAHALDRGLQGCDAAIHLVGIIRERPSKGATFERIHFEGARNVVDAVKRSGVRRYLHMSALGARADAVSPYHTTKWKAEEYVRASTLDWTIFRPSLIHGPGGEFLQMEAAWARKKKLPFFFMPYFGGGALGLGPAAKTQPVYVGDVARAFVDALEKPQTIKETYEIGGPDAMDWPTMHKRIAQVLTGRSCLTMPLPIWYAKALTYVVPGMLLPFNRSQVIMASEENTCDLAKFDSDFGWRPRGLEETLQAYKGAV
jgi:NADH dehydrogenase